MCPSPTGLSLGSGAEGSLPSRSRNSSSFAGCKSSADAAGINFRPFVQLVVVVAVPKCRSATRSVSREVRNAAMTRVLLLVIVPIAPLLQYVVRVPPLWVFLAGIAGIAVLAEWIRKATEQLALHTGPTKGGLLTVTLGSLAELVLALFVLARTDPAVVQAQITGSIIATCLLGLGLAILIGGISRERQRFRRERAGLLSSMLILVVIALLLPAIFDYTARKVVHSPRALFSDEELSLAVSSVLLLLYMSNLVFTLVTHRDVFTTGEEDADEPRWSMMTGLAYWRAPRRAPPSRAS
jgi:Ca2+:H+ antiporter